jgi:hypothetical protein
MTRTFLDPLNEAEENLRRQLEHLDIIATALATTGNRELANRLARIANHLDNVMKSVKEGRDLAFKTYVYGAEQASTNMVSAALAGIYLPQ